MSYDEKQLYGNSVYHHFCQAICLIFVFSRRNDNIEKIRALWKRKSDIWGIGVWVMM